MGEGALDRFHDEPEFRLPMPARYNVDKQGIIRATDVNADYTIRPEPSKTLRQLRTLIRWQQINKHPSQKGNIA